MDITCDSVKEKGSKTYLKVIAKTLLTWERKHMLRFRKHRESQTR